MQIHYLYPNPLFGQGNESKYVYHNPTAGHDPNQPEPPGFTDALAEGFKGEVKDTFGDISPKTVDGPEFNNAAYNKAVAHMSTYMTHLSKFLELPKKQDMLIRKMRRLKLFEPLPLGVAGIYFRYNWKSLEHNSMYLWVNLPLVRGLNPEWGYTVGSMVP